MPEPQYRENLPEGGPLPESGPIQEEMIMYRFVHNPPSEADFASHVALGKITSSKDPRFFCRALSLSVFSTYKEAKKWQSKFKLPIAKIILRENDGRICLDGKPQKKHYAWWPHASCDVLGTISEIENFQDE